MKSVSSLLAERKKYLELKSKKSLIKTGGHRKLISEIFAAAESQEQKLRLVNAYNKYPSIELMLDTKNWALAKLTVEDMHQSELITSEDKKIILDLFAIGEEVL